MCVCVRACVRVSERERFIDFSLQEVTTFICTSQSFVLCFGMEARHCKVLYHVEIHDLLKECESHFSSDSSDSNVSHVDDIAICKVSQ